MCAISTAVTSSVTFLFPYLLQCKGSLARAENAFTVTVFSGASYLVRIFRSETFVKCVRRSICSGSRPSARRLSYADASPFSGVVIDFQVVPSDAGDA